MVCEVSVRHVDFLFWFICSSDDIGLYAARTFKEVSYLLRRSFVRSSLPRDLLGCSWYDNLIIGTLCYQVTSVDCLTPSSRVNFFWVMKNVEYEVTDRYALSEKIQVEEISCYCHNNWCVWGCWNVWRVKFRRPKSTTSQKRSGQSTGSIGSVPNPGTRSFEFSFFFSVQSVTYVATLLVNFALKTSQTWALNQHERQEHVQKIALVNV